MVYKRFWGLMMVCLVWLCGCAGEYQNTEKKNYTLNWSFDINGGTGSVDSITEKYTVETPKESYGEATITGKAKVSLPYGNNLSKDGWYFCGWSTSPYGNTNNYMEGSDVTIADKSKYYDWESETFHTELLSVTWYAIWRQKHSVTFDDKTAGIFGTPMSPITYMLGLPIIQDYDCKYVGVGYSLGQFLTFKYTLQYPSEETDEQGNIIPLYPKMFKTSLDGNGKVVYKDSGSINSYTIGTDILGGDITLYPIWE